MARVRRFCLLDLLAYTISLLTEFRLSNSVTFGTDRTISPSKGLSASIVPLSHGIHHQGSPYESSAFFVNNEATGRSLLIFGDVEPDSISGLSLNKDIWTEAARRISEGRLSSMLIECSYCVSYMLTCFAKRQDSDEFDFVLQVITSERAAVWPSHTYIYCGRAARASFTDSATVRAGSVRSQRTLGKHHRYDQ